MHLGSFDGSREKCVDIALAVDMLHYATVPGAFDVAVLVSGDADFLPALVRTRQRGKRVAICSLRNSASSSFETPTVFERGPWNSFETRGPTGPSGRSGLEGGGQV